MNAPLLDQLAAKGFAVHHTGGGCQAVIRIDGPRSIVITSDDGGSLPDADDWLLAVYVGDWRAEDCGDPVEILDSAVSPVHLLDAVAFALGEAAPPRCFSCTDTGRGVCADCGNPIDASPYA